jgi:hypothetical protein
LKIFNDAGSLRNRKDLKIGRSSLRGKNTEPDLCNFPLRGPEAKKLIQISGDIRNLRRDRAMNRHSGVFDVL